MSIINWELYYQTLEKSKDLTASLVDYSEGALAARKVYLDKLIKKANRAWDLGDHEGTEIEKAYWIHGWICNEYARENPNELRNHKNMNRKELGLINYEGDVLRVRWESPTEYSIIDQWGEQLCVMLLVELCEWLEGIGSITDSQDRSWNFREQDTEARVSFYVFTKWLLECNS
jgi:hypothetical protein